MKRLFNPIIILVLLLSGCGEKPHRHMTIAVLGDSLASGFGIEQTQAFPAILEAKLKANKFDVTVLNEAVTGNTSADGLARMDDVIAKKPDLVIVELGANDMFQHLDPSTMSDNLDKIIARLKEAKIGVLLLGVKAPVAAGMEYSLQFDTMYALLVQKHLVRFQPDFLEPIRMKTAYNLPDMVHPNPEGVKLLVDTTYPFVTQTLSGLQ